MTVDHAKSALAACDRGGVLTSEERAVVREALKEYIERHKPYVAYVSPGPMPLEEQFAELCGWMARNLPGASATMAAGEFESDGYKWTDHLITITDWPLPPGYSKPKCTVYFVVPSAYYHGVPPDRFYTDALSLESGHTIYWSRPLMTRDRGSMFQPECIGARFKAPEGTMIWGWKAQSWDSRRDTLRTYVGVIKSRFENVR